MIDLFGYWLITTSLWSVGVVIFGGMLISIIGGVLLRRYYERHWIADPGTADRESSQTGVLVSGVMGLLALLIGFTFSLAISRFDTRRENVLLEANAIGTTYLRTQLLQEPYRIRLSKLLLDYTDVRIAAAAEVAGPKLNGLMQKSDQLTTELWVATVAAHPSIRSYPLSHSYLEAMNNLIDVDSIRKAGRRSHIPGTVFLALFLFQFATTGLISFVIAGRSTRQPTIMLFVLFGIALLLVVDIDRPTSGGVTESQQPMLDVKAFMKAHPPGSFDPPILPAEPSYK